MSRTITAALAAFGLVIASAIGGLLVAGLLEGMARAPGWVPESGAIVFFIGGMALTGRVAVDVAGRGAIRAVTAVAVVIALAGWMASRVTEAHGEGLETTTLLLAVGGLLVLLVTAVLAAHGVTRRTTARSL